MALLALDDFKTRIEINGTQDDAAMTAVITHAEQIVKRVIGREIENDTYTEYYDGTGTQYLNVRQGPIQSISSVSLVVYDSGGGESLTALTENSDYWTRGTADENWKLPGYLHHTTTWTEGRRNYKVVYNAGYTSGNVPADIERAAMFASTWLWNKRKDAATTDRAVADESVGFREEQDLYRELRLMLRHYRSMR